MSQATQLNNRASQSYPASKPPPPPGKKIIEMSGRATLPAVHQEMTQALTREGSEGRGGETGRFEEKPPESTHQPEIGEPNQLPVNAESEPPAQPASQAKAPAEHQPPSPQKDFPAPPPNPTDSKAMSAYQEKLNEISGQA